jgi:hypothetical protein
MRKMKCDACGLIFPLADSFRYRDAEYCSDCINSLAESPGIEKDEVRRNVDFTVCAYCGKDGGDTEFPSVSGLRVCADCERTLLHKPFPAWIKVFFAAAALAVFLGFFANRGFFVAYSHMRAGLRSAQAADLAKAASHFAEASKALPSQDDLRYSSNLYNGMALLLEEKYEAALALFGACKGVYADEAYLDGLIASAEIGDAFDKADYRRMLKSSEALLAASPSDGKLLLSVASACACLYASEGDAAFRDRAEKLIAEANAGKTAENEAEFESYAKRIRHRLATRSVISRERYYELFPVKEGEVAQ